MPNFFFLLLFRLPPRKTDQTGISNVTKCSRFARTLPAHTQGPHWNWTFQSWETWSFVLISLGKRATRIPQTRWTRHVCTSLETPHWVVLLFPQERWKKRVIRNSSVNNKSGCRTIPIERWWRELRRGRIVRIFIKCDGMIASRRHCVHCFTLEEREKEPAASRKKMVRTCGSTDGRCCF